VIANPLLAKAVIIAGTSSKILTQDICSHLGIKKAKTEISRFSDGEVSCSIVESVRGKHVFVEQT
jgi:ribose-phosphate pyrophosphokinase